MKQPRENSDSVTCCRLDSHKCWKEEWSWMSPMPRKLVLQKKQVRLQASQVQWESEDATVQNFMVFSNDTNIHVCRYIAILSRVSNKHMYSNSLWPRSPLSPKVKEPGTLLPATRIWHSSITIYFRRTPYTYSAITWKNISARLCAVFDG